MSEDEDYMSDAFLAKLDDVRPGLKRSHATQREHKLQKKKDAIEEYQIKKPKSYQLEVEKREEGLQKSLDSSNKGFALLAKMGYKAGESLGKAKSGRLEPIPIEVKTNRSGLGRDAAIQHIKETKAKLKSMKKLSAHNPTSTAEFRASQSLKIRAKRVESDLFNSQKACRQLDLGKEFSEPVEPWFWPKPIEDKNVDDEEAKIQEIVDTEEEDENEEEVEIPPEEMLKILTEYLRAEYLFCIWCGITFQDVEDLNNSCPGNDRDSHDE